MYKMIITLNTGAQVERIFSDTTDAEIRTVIDRIANAMEQGAKTMTLTALNNPNAIILHLPNISTVTFDKI